jgi:hypothetical protein
VSCKGDHPRNRCCRSRNVDPSGRSKIETHGGELQLVTWGMLPSAAGQPEMGWFGTPFHEASAWKQIFVKECDGNQQLLFELMATEDRKAFRWTCCGQPFGTLFEEECGTLGEYTHAPWHGKGRGKAGKGGKGGRGIRGIIECYTGTFACCNHHGKGCACDHCDVLLRTGIWAIQHPTQRSREHMPAMEPAPYMYVATQHNRFLRLPNMPPGFCDWDLAEGVPWATDSHRHFPAFFRGQTMALMLLWQRMKIPTEPLLECFMPLFCAGLLTQGSLGVPQDPLAPRRGPLESSPDKQSTIGNAPALVPGSLARLQYPLAAAHRVITPGSASSLSRGVCSPSARGRRTPAWSPSPASIATVGSFRRH